MSRRSVQRIVKHDWQLKAFSRREVHLLSDADKLKRLTASKRSLRRLTKAKLTRTWFSSAEHSKSLFTVVITFETLNT